jgi:glycerol-3-phosphate cytidylyltransferase-like family protein/SAM-dependent methyltransferase
MILAFDQLRDLQGKVVMVDGGFDPLHLGHVLYFRRARAEGLPVLCNVSADSYVSTKHPVLLPQSIRCQLIDEFESISYVHPSNRTTAEILEEARPKAFVKGSDWKGRLPAEEAEACRRHAIEVIFADTVVDSSTRRMDAVSAGGSVAEQVAAFEEFLHRQKANAAEVFDAPYFHSDWRSDSGGNYTIAERRRIEGRNPELIRDVFRASSVLDVGCGPGALMFLLHELGVEADGVDIAAASKELAPPEVRERIRIGSAGSVDLPSGSYELVICREVLEHMTVLQVQQAVQNICRISSRYVYVTTRFHPEPRGLFDVTTEFDVDPTHITLMHIELLRLMFVLQGLRRRADLEARMDWLGKGRVLVYEKTA